MAPAILLLFRRVTKEPGSKLISSYQPRLWPQPPNLIQDETGYEEGWPGNHLQFEDHCKVLMPGLQLSAGQAIFKDKGFYD